uniref:Uncharacterized protein n=1 Tax=Mandrillus leucophaeus TaxID=9568 RepID=A0A2K5XPI5_MANLE
MCPYLSSLPTHIFANFRFNSHSSASISMAHNCNFNLLFFFCIFDIFQTLQKLARILQNSWILCTQITQMLACYHKCPVTLASLSLSLFFSLIYIRTPTDVIFFLNYVKVANSSFTSNNPG